MNEFLNKIKVKYNYSDEFIKILSDIMYSFLIVLGESNLDKILYVFENIFIYEFENVKEAGIFATTYFDNGKTYSFSSRATGGGVTENDYYLDDNGNLREKVLILLQKGDYSEKSIQTLIHEICHGISSINGFVLKDSIIHTVSGVSSASYEFNGKYKGRMVEGSNNIFNEIITENLAVQVMDVYNNKITHKAINYSRITENFRNIFRNESINSVIINDYLDHSSNFMDVLNTLYTEEDLKNIVEYLYTVVDINNSVLKEYLNTLYNMTIEDFFNIYIEYNNYIYGNPINIDRETFRIMKQINNEIVLELSNKLEINIDL